MKSCEVSYPKMSTFYFGVHFIKEVTLPSLTFHSKPHCGQCYIWLGVVGGGVREGSAICLCFCYYFQQAQFFMFSGLLVFLFVKLLYYTA